MGMPACRITDLTAHGGIVMLGFPQVLIGALPASRIGDNHVCPMVTGVVPHVGGPFVLGAFTVLVGGVPQSRVTDMLVCVGPPDVAVKGEPTVLVGMAGAGGAMGAVSGASAAGSLPGAGVAGAVAGAAAALQAKAEAQADGTMKTFAPAGGALPPVTLKQAGWPDLPPEHTATFESVQPATVMPGTALYATGGADSGGDNSYWSAAPPVVRTAASAAQAGVHSAGQAAGNVAAQVNALQEATHVHVATVPPGPGIKVWAGKAAEGALPGEAGTMQVWAPAAALAGAAQQRFRLPGGGA